MQQLQIGRVYRHFKGDYYLVEALAKDSESRTLRNLPEALRRWRPVGASAAMFLSKVDREKYPDAEQEYRFALQDIQAPPVTKRMRVYGLAESTPLRKP